MNIALLGDSSTHGGALISALQAQFFVNNILVCADGSILECPIHGQQPVAAITLKSYVAGLRILTHGAIAACSATIIAPDRGVYVEL